MAKMATTMKPATCSDIIREKSVIFDKCQKIGDVYIPVEILQEVGVKLIDPNTKCAFGDVPPPLYSEREPLEPPSSGASSTSDDSFDDWQKDELDDGDDESGVETCPNWSDLGRCGKVKRVIVTYIGKFLALLFLLYTFICSLGFLSAAFRLLGGKTAGSVFSESELLSNPVAGLMIGILATVLVQSSSTSTSIVVTMVASGIIDVNPAIPIIMGANIGTSVTNTFVSMAQSGRRQEFRRAFAGATVHDMFNWLTVFALLPVEVLTGYLQKLTRWLVENCNLTSFKGGKQDLLKVITKPLTKLVIQIDKKIIEKIAAGHKEYADQSLIKKYCVFDKVTAIQNVTEKLNASMIVNGTEQINLLDIPVQKNVTTKVPVEKCYSLFSYLDLSDTFVGVILLVFSISVLCTCLVMMVKLLNSMMKGSVCKVIKKTINADFPGCFKHLTGYVAIIIGAILTILVQSSSIFTSTLTPLVGMGLVRLERMYPLTLGSNIGTTMTGVLAALAAPGDKIDVALQISFCHLFFNISGILLFYPIPFMRKLPIKAAKYLGSTTAKYRWFSILYLLLMFVLLPLSVFALSIAGRLPLIIVGCLLLAVVMFTVILNILQSKCSKCLPKCLRTWEFLPSCVRSLEPLDKIICKISSLFTKCRPCCQTICCCTETASKLKPKNYREPDSQDSTPAASRFNSTVALMSNKDLLHKSIV